MVYFFPIRMYQVELMLPQHEVTKTLFFIAKMNKVMVEQRKPKDQKYEIQYLN